MASFNYDACIQYLMELGAGSQRHSARTLLVHLERTFRILEAAGQPAHICYAGLMHSIYGTSIFKKQSVGVEARPLVRSLIGDEAEYLVWLFCSLDRPTALIDYVEGSSSLRLRDDAGHWDVTSDQQKAIASELLVIEAANLLDQQTLWSSSWLIPTAKASGLLSDDGYCILRSSELYSDKRIKELRRMLDAARQGARAKLVQKINAIRLEVASDLVGGDSIRRLKLHQAILYQEAKSKGEESQISPAEIPLLMSYANAYGRSVDEAVETIFACCEKHDDVLLRTEIIKDQMSGRLSAAESLAEIEDIRKSIDLMSI